MLASLLLSIPAFYLALNETLSPYHDAGRWLYAAVTILIGVHLYVSRRKDAGQQRFLMVDFVIFAGALLSAWQYDPAWHAVEWLLRLVYCAIVFLRLATLLARHVAPHRLLQIAALALFLLAVAGEGFYLLEPKVQNYADGVWLAFLTGATLGYGDMVPSTPASRVFAVFIVLLGYALFSVFTASISAILVGEDEKLVRRELHADTKLLRAEIAALRAELKQALQSGQGGIDRSG
ncbi:potassium channel family protein [Herbaspirillum sp. RV1423]|uniref:potassium channel family protein n=1 Tax=Herbaspirillum sp. RV1423 TaxID=1443993 RepID=UPI0004BC655B|nr:potassium channel family protein [Herbaspirillum sp. RV1423]